MTPQERSHELELCSAVVRSEGYGPTAINPPEYCDREVEPGSEFCNQHQGYDEQ
jgi:hypothetical protein